jgi:hypothetical protein
MEHRSMFGQYDASDLLAYIEDRLAPEEVDRIRRAFSATPGALETIERMKADRAVLRGLPMPSLEDDLVAALEPALARPMLLEPISFDDARERARASGTYRLSRRAPARWPRYLVAAGLMIVATGASLHFLLPLVPGGASQGFDGRLAQAEPTDEELNATREADALARGDIHHWRLPDDSTVAARGRVAPALDHGEESHRLAGIVLPSGVESMESPSMLVVQRLRLQDLLDALATAVSAHESAALVRNFSLAEAEAYWSDLVASSDLPVERRERVFAALRAHQAAGAALDRADRQVIDGLVKRSPRALGEHLAGDQSAAAAPEQQLRFAEHGAAHSLTVPASLLPSLLESLESAFGRAVALRPLDAANETEGASALSEWNRWRAWRASVDGVQQFLRDADDDMLIVIPVSAAGE